MQPARRRLLTIGLVAAVAALAFDQASKFWLLSVFDIARRGVVHVTPFFDLVLTWNKGVSYGWFQTTSASGELALLGIKIAAVIGLGIWLSRAHSALAATALGLIIGGGTRHPPDRVYFWAGVGFFPFL